MITRTFIITLAIVLFFNITSLNAQDLEQGIQKFEHVLENVENYYVDSLHTEKLIEQAIISTLKELDPHSRYFTKEEQRQINRRMQGSFDGIGITYNMVRDTLYILSVVKNAPAENAGLRAGDRIIKVENECIAGVSITTAEISELIGGKRGSKVNLSVKRHNSNKLLNFTVTRGKIPVHSVDAAYTARPGIAYIKLSKFSATSGTEVKNALKKLKAEGAKHVILDLRNNTGGYLTAAVQVTEQFIEADKLVVYTEGKHAPRQNYFSHKGGEFTKGRIIVLVNNNTASASEIVTGALQDWDRAVVIGQKTYGKGLVQRPFELNDGSVMRLTIARYYTPSGRCIQKPYKINSDIISKAVNDTIKLETSEYQTLTHKRTVYSGGGIQPDIEIKIDTTKYPEIYKEWIRDFLVRDFVYDYLDLHRNYFKTIYPDFEKFKANYETDELFIRKLCQSALAGKDIDYQPISNELYKNKAVKLHLKSLIANDLWSNSEFYQIQNEGDREFLKAVECIKELTSYEKILAESGE